MIATMPQAGTHSLGPEHGAVLVRTQREGVASRFGHDLTLEVTRWTATVVVDSQNVERSSVNARLDARSLEIKEATGGSLPLSDKDRGDIRKNIAEKVLLTEHYPEITFESTEVEVSGENLVTVAGNLRIVATSRLVQLPLSVQQVDDAARMIGAVSLQQSDWGIKPFSAMMGALKMRDQVEVSIEVRLPVG